MPQPYPGQDWKHGWVPVTPQAAVSKNHGRPVKKGGGAARTATKAAPKHSKPADKTTKPGRSKAGTGETAPTPAPKAGTNAPSAPSKGKEFIDEHYADWKGGLSPAQEKAMRFYQSPGFALMNGQLRGLDKKDIKADVSFNDSDLERARKASKDLTSAIRKAPPLKEPMTVYRGFSATQFGDLRPGMEVSDKGFVSTSITPDVGSVGKAAKPATAEIILPKGTKAAAGSARELVLPPGSKFRIHSVTTRRGVLHVRMELVP